MPRAVRFNQYGDRDVLQVVEVERPIAGPGQVIVKVKAAAINPGEASIRKGVFAEVWPTTFPSGQGSDFAGIVDELGDGVISFAVGDEVIGFTDNRASQAEYVLAEADHLVRRPSNVPWEVAGSLFVAGTTAYATVRAVVFKPGDTVAVAGAAGGVGSIAVQLAVRAGATVLGIASPARHQWLKDHGVIPVAYGEGIADRIQVVANHHLDAFIDTFGADYVELALKLGVEPQRINTIINFDAVKKYGIKAEGNAAAASVDVLSELAALIDQGLLEIPIAHVYPLAEVREAYRELEQHHTFGKIVLVP